MPKVFHLEALPLVIDVLFHSPKRSDQSPGVQRITLKTCTKNGSTPELYLLGCFPEGPFVTMRITHQNTKKKHLPERKQKNMKLLYIPRWKMSCFFGGPFDPGRVFTFLANFVMSQNSKKYCSNAPPCTQCLLPTSIPGEGHDGSIVGDDVWANAIALHVAQHAHGFAPESSKD